MSYRPLPIQRSSTDRLTRSTRAGFFMIDTVRRPSRRRRPAADVVIAVLIAVALLAGQAGAVAAQDDTASPAAGTPSASPVAPTGDPVEVATAWLVAQQAEDGGFIGFSGESDAGLTADALQALRAAEVAGVDVAAAIERAGAFLVETGPAYAATGAGQSAKVVLGLVAAGVDPTAVGGTDLLANIGPADVETGLFGGGVYGHALVLLAHAATGQTVDAAMVDALRAHQIDDGAWAFDGTTDSGAGDSNTTALAIQALVATGNGDDPMLTAATAYLQASQIDSGAFGFQPGGEADANSTALALQAIVAIGDDPTGSAWNDAASALPAFLNPSGALRFTDDEPADNIYATVQAIPALAGLPLPVAEACRPGTTAGTPVTGPTVIALPEPASGQAPCVDLVAA
jgi:hypothetical protein